MRQNNGCGEFQTGQPYAEISRLWSGKSGLWPR